jgi:flagellar hook-associated protein 2
MGGSFSVGGLITGINSNELISQLMQLERQPIVRLQERIGRFNQQRDAIRTLRTTLTNLRNVARDFRSADVFNQFSAASSNAEVLTAEISGSTPVTGAYTVNVTLLASATIASSSARLGAAINPAAALNASGITTEIEAGTFTINGVEFTLDPSTDTLNSILAEINASSAGVTATYDSGTDRVTFTNSAPADTSIINFGGADDDSNFLTVISVMQATQTTGAGGSTEVTGTRNLGAVDPADALNTVNFDGGAVTAGSFKINGITITVDPTADSLSDVLGRINDSDAGVTASYDSSTDTIRLVSETLGSRTINFQAGTSNFLTVTNLASATQSAGNDAQFTINGGPTLTRNTNEVSDAIGGVTLNLLSLGSSTVTVAVDDDAIIEDVNRLIEQFNNAIGEIRGQIGSGGLLEGDSSIRLIQDYLQTTIFSRVSGVGGQFQSLADIGITTGSAFNSETQALVQLDEDVFREALRGARTNVRNLFSNSAGTGVADSLFTYLEGAVSNTGFLNERSRSNGILDQQIQAVNDRITRMEDRIATKERRLRLQFSRLEQLAAGFQSQGQSLAGLATQFRRFI